MENKKYYCGVDQSLNSTALVIIDDEYNLKTYFVFGNVKKYQQYGHNYIYLDKELKDMNRIIKVVNEVIRTINGYKFYLDKVAIEGYSYSSVNRSSYQLGELAGVMKFKMIMNGINYEIIEPSVMKKIITGKGNAKKDLVEEKLKEFHPYLRDEFDKFGNYRKDLYDAFGIAKTLKILTNSSDF